MPGLPRVQPLALRLDIAPNPVRARTQIAFGLHADADVTRDLVDLAGRRVDELIHEQPQTAGWHTVQFSRAGLPAGLYFVTLRAGGETLGRKVLLAN